MGTNPKSNRTYRTTLRCDRCPWSWKEIHDATGFDWTVAVTAFHRHAFRVHGAESTECERFLTLEREPLDGQRAPEYHEARYVSRAGEYRLAAPWPEGMGR